MSPLTPLVTKVLSVLTITGQVMVLVMVLAMIFRKNKFSRYVMKFVNKNVLVFSFVVVLIATLGSLFYSELAGYAPCKLCWYQRILMYPQVLLFVIAMWKEERHILDYSVVMVAAGALIALYHYLLQIGVIEESSCSELGYSVSCSDNFSMNFGYITIPMMAVTAFLMVLFFALIGKRTEKKG